MKLVKTLFVIGVIIYSLFFIYSSVFNKVTEIVSIEENIGYKEKPICKEDEEVIELWRNYKLVGYGCHK